MSATFPIPWIWGAQLALPLQWKDTLVIGCAKNGGLITLVVRVSPEAES